MFPVLREDDLVSGATSLIYMWNCIDRDPRLMLGGYLCSSVRFAVFRVKRCPCLAFKRSYGFSCILLFHKVFTTVRCGTARLQRFG
jgi:hypothetical protein